MSQLRKDPISGRWVIIASERSKRPDDFRPHSAPSEERQEKFCPFCQGNESKTPPEVFSFRQRGTGENEPGWWIRVVPNKFPALNRGKPPALSGRGLFQWMEGVGVHEVVIETPEHDKEMSDLPVEHVRDILLVYRDRIKSVESETQYQYIQVFKNKGREAGASLSHPHSQIVATPIVPKGIKEEIYGAERLFRGEKECIFCRIVREEVEQRERIIFQNKHFCAIASYASRFPFEMRLYPLRHSPFFSSLEKRELLSLAEALRAVLSSLKRTLTDPPFNLVIHQAPNPYVSKKKWMKIEKNYHWHIEIIPVLTRMAGFEWGTGIYINPVPPETAASYLRQNI